MHASIPDMPPVQFATINGVRMAYYEAGPKGRGAPVVFSHGFPELAYSWRHQLKALAEAGRWVVAPDQRGYGLTGRPDPIEAYDMEHLTGDLVGLIDHLGAKQAIWCGHDWGGAVVWQMPLRHSDRTAGVIGLNTPFQPRAPMDPIAIMRARLGDEMYIVHFQKPGEADAVLARDVRATLEFFLRRPPERSAGAPDAVSGDAISGDAISGDGESKGFATERAKDGPSVFPLVRMVEAYDPANDRRGRFLNPAEFEVFVQSFTRTGFTGGINWYRNITRNWERSSDLPDRVEAPSLMIMAEKDAVLPPSSADGMGGFISDLEKVLVLGSGHWTQQEAPEQVNRILIDWLDRRFPSG
jgi:pimeloyl-ACP methyl ester carboxylesterase